MDDYDTKLKKYKLDIMKIENIYMSHIQYTNNIDNL